MRYILISATLAVDKVVSYRIFYAEDWDRPRESQPGICGGQNGAGIDFSSRTWSFPRLCRSTNKTYWFVRLLYSQRYVILAIESVGDTLVHHICM
jgi:hypothetical protein